MVERDETDFEAFVGAVSPRLLSLAWLLTGERGREEDLVQEALVRVYAAWPGIDPGGSVNYTRRVLLNLHSRDQRRRGREVLSAEPPDRAATDSTDGIAEADRLSTALRDLPLRERQCVALRHHADLSEATVAELLGVNVGTVKSSTSRGLARLRATLSEAGILR